MKTLLCLIISTVGCAFSQEVWTLRSSPQTVTTTTAVGGRTGLYLVSTSTLDSTGPITRSQTYRSTDGLTWNVVLLPRAGVFATEGNKLIGVGADGIWTTEDGLTFTWSFRANNGLAPEGIAYGNGCWVVTGGNGDIIRGTTAAGTWSYQTSPTDSIGGLAFGNGVFVARSGTSEIITSADGISWVISAANGLLDDVQTFANGEFIARTRRSADNGATWTIIPTTGITNLMQIAVGPNRFVGRGTNQYVWTGVTLGTWTQRTTGLSSSSPVTHIGWCGDLWVASGSGIISTAPLVNVAPPVAPPLSISPAVELNWPSITGRRYQVQGSTDNVVWADVGLPLLGNGSPLKFTVPAADVRKFFRVEVR